MKKILNSGLDQRNVKANHSCKPTHFQIRYTLTIHRLNKNITQYYTYKLYAT